MYLHIRTALSDRGLLQGHQGHRLRRPAGEFENRVILPHERTLSKAKDDRLELLSATRTNVSQIYSMYMDEAGETTSRIAALSSAAPDIEFQTDDGCTHRLWIVDDPRRSRALRVSLLRASSILRTGTTAMRRRSTTGKRMCSAARIRRETA